MKSQRGITEAERRRREAQQAEAELIKGANSKVSAELAEAKIKLASGYTYIPDASTSQQAVVNVMAAKGIWGANWNNYIQGVTGTWVSPSNQAASPSSQNLIVSPSYYQWSGSTNYLSFQTLLQPPSQSPSKKRLPSRRFHMPVVGYRSWHVDFVGEKVVLGSTGVSCKWKGARLDARCTGGFYIAQGERVKHRSPHESCTCGIYVYKKARNIAAEHGELWGVVVTWGKHVEHGEEGYRAAHARAIAFVEPSPTGDFKTWLVRTAIAAEAAKRLHLPLVRQEAIATYAAEFGREFKD